MARTNQVYPNGAYFKFPAAPPPIEAH